MSNYILRDLPQHIWDRFKARCLRDGWHMKALFLQLMEDYGAGRITPSTEPGSRPTSGFFTFPCSKGHESTFRMEKAQLRARLDADPPMELHCFYCGERLALSTQDLAHLESYAHTPDPPTAPQSRGDE